MGSHFEDMGRGTPVNLVLTGTRIAKLRRNIQVVKSSSLLAASFMLEHTVLSATVYVRGLIVRAEARLTARSYGSCRDANLANTAWNETNPVVLYRTT